MSQFLDRIRERFRTKKRHSQSPVSQHESANLSALMIARDPLRILAILGNKIGSPPTIASSLSLIFILLCCICIGYWILHIAQLPSIPLVNKDALRGKTLYQNHTQTGAYALFGSKPLLIENIFLRGVVITSISDNERLEGFAIFEIDGKQTSAISVGENFGKGLKLQSISPESATLLYEGQKLDFKLTKSGGLKSSSKK